VIIMATRKATGHDDSPAIISDHAFDPLTEWWTLCKVCGLAQAAHVSSTPAAIAEMQAEFDRLRKGQQPVGRERYLERQRERLHSGGRARIGYYSDDNYDDE
jgi:hypothetical protein